MTTRKLALEVLICAALAAPAAARAVDFSYSAFSGYQDGLGLRLGVTAHELARGLPLSAELSVGYAFRDPGDPVLARQVFINQNQDGTPEKSGHAWDFRLDGIYFLRVPWLSELGLYGGVRHSRFSGDFKYVGGNEDFEVTANQWGFGLGARAGWSVSPTFTLTATVGLDFYPWATIYGHSASYSSDGTVVDGRTNGNGVAYTWADADKAVNQPKVVPALLVGVTWRPGAPAARSAAPASSGPRPRRP